MSKRPTPSVWRLFTPYILTMCIAFAVITYHGMQTLESTYISAIKQELTTTLLVTRASIQNTPNIDQDHDLNAYLSKISEKSDIQISFSQEPIKRPNDITISQSIPLDQYAPEKGVLNALMPMQNFQNSLQTVLWSIISVAGLVMLITTLISYFISRRLTKPIIQLAKNAKAIAYGKFTTFPNVPKGEFEVLGNALNHMAKKLNDRFETIVNERNEKESILSNMLEGVITLDTKGNILTINRAAKQHLNIRSPEPVKIQELETLINIFDSTLNSKVPIEKDIVLSSPTEKILQAHGSKFKSGDQKTIGVIIVLNNLTKIKKLEKMRKEFVGNVSHELKTPITLIKGFVETLLDGAIDDKEEAQKFLKIIASHSDRLNSIIEDLLTLSRIEQGEERSPFFFEKTELYPLLVRCITALEPKAAQRGIKVNLTTPKKLLLNANPQLLNQALSNLIDNAIKYSYENTTVNVTIEHKRDQIQIHIEDNGPGIPDEHLKYLFQRFYRVDKARSRNVGGTGLGLAIVKHIAQIHSGNIEVKSIVTKGSTFTLTLPQKL